MIKNLTILVYTLLTFTNCIYAQMENKVILKVKNYPKSISNYTKLATRINRDFDSQREKAEAIYFWIANNVSYDVKSLYNNKNDRYSYTYKTKEQQLKKEQKYIDKTAQSTFRRKKAVCEGYSILFKKLCDLTQVECVVITGSSKTKNGDIGKSPRGSDHAWNAVKLENNWHLIDVTWGAGSVDNKTQLFRKEFDSSYFLTSPDLFLLKHFPQDPKWLLTDKTKKYFTDLPLYYSKSIEIGLKIEYP